MRERRHFETPHSSTAKNFSHPLQNMREGYQAICIVMTLNWLRPITFQTFCYKLWRKMCICVKIWSWNNYSIIIYFESEIEWMNEQIISSHDGGLIYRSYWHFFTFSLTHYGSYSQWFFHPQICSVSLFFWNPVEYF